MRDIKNADIDRIIDDFVLLSFFLGNDFLPHLPNFSISDGGLDAILAIYKRTLPFLDDYLTKDGNINQKNLTVFIKELGHLELGILIGNQIQEGYKNEYKANREEKRNEK